MTTYFGETQVSVAEVNTFTNKWKIIDHQEDKGLETLAIDYGKCSHSEKFAFAKGFAILNKDYYVLKPQCMWCENSDTVKALQKDPNSILYIKP